MALSVLSMLTRPLEINFRLLIVGERERERERERESCLELHYILEPSMIQNSNPKTKAKIQELTTILGL